MSNQLKTGIIIQARMGSTRLPGKMAKKFYDGNTLLDVLIERLLPFSKQLPIVVATTEKDIDDFIEETALKKDIPVFRGSENDVLSRFIGAAEQYNIDMIIRICSDNPFIQPRFIQELINVNRELTADYVGFRLNGARPAIKTHLGFFPEMVSLKALESINVSDLNPMYREHVTNYFYMVKNDFFVKYLDLRYPEEVIQSVRLTIDVEEDFEIANQIYRHFNKHGLEDTDEEIIAFVKNNPFLIKKMKENIERNEK